MRTVWELDGKTLRTGEAFGDMMGPHWEEGGEKKSLSPCLLKKKKTGPFRSVCYFFFLFLFLIQFLPPPLVEAKNGHQQFSKPKIQATNW
jgi:hypothetical protein